MNAADFALSLRTLGETALQHDRHPPFIRDQIVLWTRLTPRSEPLGLSGAAAGLADPVLDLVRGWNVDGLRLSNFYFRDAELKETWPGLFLFAIHAGTELYVDLRSHVVYGFYYKEFQPSALDHDSGTFLAALLLYAQYLEALTVEVQASAAQTEAVKTSYRARLAAVVSDPFWSQQMR
jgi:hypothetical protein